MENNKKILVPTIIAVVTLILLVFGATYAYFTVGSTNNFGTKELNATVEGMAEDIILQQVENELSLDVTRAMMSEDNAGTAYYASGSSTPASIAKISTTGEGTFTCTYKVSVTKSATNDLYTAFQGMSTKSANQLYLSINDSKYDFNTTSLFPITYNGTIRGVSKDTPQYITANLALLNKNVNQNVLKGKDVTLTFSISNFNCELETIEYTELAFTNDYLDDIGYEYSYDEKYWYKDNEIVKDIVIPETFQGKDGIWYKVTSIAHQDSEEGEIIMDDIETLLLPNSVVSIHGLAFYGIDTETLKLPKKLVSITGDGIIADSEVKNIYLPKSLTYVFESSLAGAILQNVYYEGTEAEWNALFSEYVGEGKDYSTIFEYLGIFIDDESGYNGPTIHYNVNY